MVEEEEEKEKAIKEDGKCGETIKGGRANGKNGGGGRIGVGKKGGERKESYGKPV